MTDPVGIHTYNHVPIQYVFRSAAPNCIFYYPSCGRILTMMSIVTSLRISDILMSSTNFLSESTSISLVSYDHASIHASSHLLSCQQFSILEMSSVTQHLHLAVHVAISFNHTCYSIWSSMPKFLQLLLKDISKQGVPFLSKTFRSVFNTPDVRILCTSEYYALLSAYHISRVTIACRSRVPATQPNYGSSHLWLNPVSIVCDTCRIAHACIPQCYSIEYSDSSSMLSIFFKNNV